VLSLLSIYSTSGNKDLLPPKPEMMEQLRVPALLEREAYIKHMVEIDLSRGYERLVPLEYFRGLKPMSREA